jgi:hypothetical protein
MEKALVLSGDAWNMTDEKTGQMLNGISVWFLTPYREQGVKAGEAGYKPAKVGASPELFEKLRNIKLPAMCDMVYGAKPGAAGKATLVLIDVLNPVHVDVFGLSSDRKVK